MTTKKRGASPGNTQAIGLSRGLTNYGDADFSLYMRRSFARSMGYSPELLARPVVGIAQTASGFNNCHRHFPELVEAVKRGVIAAGGLRLYNFLGGYAEGGVEAYASGGYYLEGKTPAKLGAELAGYIGRGFRAVKTKLGHLDSKAEGTRIAAARKGIGPEMLLMLDA